MFIDQLNYGSRNYNEINIDNWSDLSLRRWIGVSQIRNLSGTSTLALGDPRVFDYGKKKETVVSVKQKIGQKWYVKVRWS